MSREMPVSSVPRRTISKTPRCGGLRLALLAGAALAGSAAVAHAQPVLTGDTVWEAGTSYEWPIGVTIDGSLTIEEGVLAEFGSSAFLFVLQGSTLTIEGTAAEPVILTSTGTAEWNGIFLTPTSSADIRHAVVTEFRNTGIRGDQTSGLVVYDTEILGPQNGSANRGIEVTGGEIAKGPVTIARVTVSDLGGNEGFDGGTGGNGGNGANGQNTGGFNGEQGGQGDPGEPGTPGGDVIGIDIWNTGPAVVHSVTVSNLFAGRGGTGGIGGTGGTGGVGRTGSNGTTVGGVGGGGGQGGTGGTGGRGGPGGDAIGVRAQFAAGLSVANVVVDNLISGQGGRGGRGGNGGTGGRGGRGGDATCFGCSFAIGGNGGIGGRGGTTGTGGQGGDGGRAYGIYHDNILTDSVIANCTVFNLDTQPGGSGGNAGLTGGSGGSGGSGGFGSSLNGFGGQPGLTGSIGSIGSTGPATIAGGFGGRTWDSGHRTLNNIAVPGTEGDGQAFGFAFADSPAVTDSRNDLAAETDTDFTTGFNAQGFVSLASLADAIDIVTLLPIDGSPALDSGDSEWLPADLADLDGDGDTDEPLPHDRAGLPRISGSAPDRGAFEFPQELPCVADVTTLDTNPGDPGYGEPDGSINAEDLTYFVEQWINGVAAVADVTTLDTNPGEPGYGEPDGSINAEDLTFFVEQWITGCP
jgi:hypothetical protein